MTLKVHSMAAVLAALIASPAFAATVTLDFEGQGRLLPLGSAEQTFSKSLGSDTDFIQFRETKTVNTGEVNSNVQTDLTFDFDTSVALTEAANTQVKFQLNNMDASYQTVMSYREKKDVVFRWNPIPVPDVLGADIAGGSQRETILDEGGALVTRASGTNLSFVPSGTAVPTLSDSDNITFTTPLIPVPNKIKLLEFATSATTSATHESNLLLGQLTGKLIATHRDTGFTRMEDFSLRNGEVVVDFDLAKAGIWDLAFGSLDIENVLFSDLTQRGTQRAAVYAEVPIDGGCGDPFNKNDNGSVDVVFATLPTCFFETGAEFLNVESKLFDNAPTQINYTLTQGGSIGSITVKAADIAPVPLPAGGLLLLSGLAGLCIARRRRS